MGQNSFSILPNLSRQGLQMLDQYYGLTVQISLSSGESALGVVSEIQNDVPYSVSLSFFDFREEIR